LEFTDNFNANKLLGIVQIERYNKLQWSKIKLKTQEQNKTLKTTQANYIKRLPHFNHSWHVRVKRKYTE